MSHNSHPDVAPESTYPSLERPEFRSQIPPHLLADASDAEKHIVEQLSILTQFAQWSTTAHISTMESVRKTNGRLIRAEENLKEIQDDKKLLKSGWKAVVVIGGVISGFASFIALIWQTVGGK
jgi:hypothetical protein